MGELVERFRAKFLTVTGFTNFISLRDTTWYATKLESLLEDIATDVDPATGVNLLVSFFEVDLPTKLSGGAGPTPLSADPPDSSAFALTLYSDPLT